MTEDTDTERIIEYNYMDDHTLFVYTQKPDGTIVCETWEKQDEEKTNKELIDFTGVSSIPYPYTGPFPNKEH